MSNRCPCCSGKLNESITKIVGGNILKSCPLCSVTKGEHVFFLRPDDFGVSDRRETERNPDGVQSYCEVCRHIQRGNPSINFNNGIPCSQLPDE